MRKIGFVIGLILLITLNSAAMASAYSKTSKVTFQVAVAPYAIIEFAKPLPFNLSNGAVAKEVTSNGTVLANIPLDISITTGSFGDVNDFFNYSINKSDANGNKVITTQTPGSTTTYTNVPQGKTILDVTLISAIPAGKGWYDLTAGTYVSAVEVTVSARDN